jgi:hypothetical protein
MTTIPEATHRFEPLFTEDDNRVFRITLRRGGVFRLNCFTVLDPSIYGIPDQWCANVVEPIEGKHPKFHKLFHAGSGVDFVESDITEIVDDATGEVIYR